MANKLLKIFTVAGLAVASMSAYAVQASEGGSGIQRQSWTFAGIRGHFDRAQLQRGFQVYREVCSTCHGLDRIYFRNLSEKGGPEFPEAGVKGLAESYKIVDGPNDQGKMFRRPGRPSDRIPGPYENEQEARLVNRGALPPDFSLIAKARKVETESPFYMVPWNFLRDVFLVGGYQEGGPDYIYALLNSYKDNAPAYKEHNGHLEPMPEAQAASDPTMVRCATVSESEDGKGETCNKMSEGMMYNAAFPGHQIAMPPPPIDDGMIKYKDGTPSTHENYARDVVAFLAWAADPKLEERKRLGLMSVLYLFITSVLLYLAKRRIWSGVAH